MAWGGPEEQAREWELGNQHAKDWQDEALKIIEKAMADYWQESLRSTAISRPAATRNTTGQSGGTTVSEAPSTEIHESEFDRHRRSLIAQSAQTDDTGGWAAELRRYLADLPADVEKHTDVIKWWQVRGPVVSSSINYSSSSQDNAKSFPTLAHIAKDICAIPATSVPCERLFSAGAEIATDRCNRLGSDIFEKLQILKHEWSRDVVDEAHFNSAVIEDITLEPFKDYLTWETNLQSSLDGARVVPAVGSILVV